MRNLPSTCLEGWVTSLHAKRKSPATVQLRIAGVTAYLDFLKRHGVVDDVPFRPKLPSQPVSTITFHLGDGVLEKVFYAIDRLVPEPYATAIKLLPYSGLRLHELCQLKLGDVRAVWAGKSEALVLRVLGKGKKTRDVPLLPAGDVLLRDYLTSQKPSQHTPEVLSWSESKRNALPLFSSLKTQTKSISAKLVERYIRTLRDGLKALGIKLPNLTAHKFRHHFVTELHKNGVRDLDLAMIAGHENLSTTRRYTHPTTEDLATIVRRTTGDVSP